VERERHRDLEHDLIVDAKKNFAYSAVATAPSPATTGTSLVVTASDGTKFPAPPFNVTVWPTGQQPTVANAEIVRVTNIATDTLTIVREQEGTTARTIVVGDQIAAAVTLKVLSDLESEPLTEAEGRTIPAGRSVYIPDDYRIPAGIEVRVGVGSILRIK
jgi:hypothetical protein